MRQTMFYEAESQLKAAELLPERRYHRPGGGVINEILKKGSISSGDYYQLVGAYTGDRLLETNVFAYHIKSGKISFLSTVMKRFCEKNAALWKEK